MRLTSSLRESRRDVLRHHCPHCVRHFPHCCAVKKIVDYLAASRSVCTAVHKAAVARGAEAALLQGRSVGSRRGRGRGVRRKSSAIAMEPSLGLRPAKLDMAGGGGYKSERNLGKNETDD